AYQTVAGKRQQVACDYSIAPGGNSIGFKVARYDASRPLVVDPTLAYSTRVGGGGYDLAYASCAGPSGVTYVTGATTSANYPTSVGAYSTTMDGSNPVYLTAVGADLGSLLFSTFLGGSGDDSAAAIASDSTGIYVAGLTYSSNFPSTPGAFDTTYNGFGDMFATKFTTTGNALVYSTYMGTPSMVTSARSLAVDASGNAYIGGTTGAGFPTTSGAYSRTFSGG
ncbi:MAG: SBBP repeat-containing protein, partial [Verrucomicrobia bacterium]|nr:SBBP repeat-containing protein [Verrucomicrobiota bacterium]